MQLLANTSSDLVHIYIVVCEKGTLSVSLFVFGTLTYLWVVKQNRIAIVVDTDDRKISNLWYNLVGQNP